MCNTDRESGRYDIPGGEDIKRSDPIAAEDTRNSIKLLNHFEIKTPMTSYHEYNKIEKGHKLVERLQGGENIAVITDAGMPGISDPGEELVKMCQEAGSRLQLFREPVHVSRRLRYPDLEREGSHLRHFFQRIRKKDRPFWRN